MATIDDLTITPYSGTLSIDALLSEGPDWDYLTPGRTTLYYTFSLGVQRHLSAGLVEP